MGQQRVSAALVHATDFVIAASAATVHVVAGVAAAPGRAVRRDPAERSADATVLIDTTTVGGALRIALAAHGTVPAGIVGFILTEEVALAAVVAGSTDQATGWADG